MRAILSVIPYDLYKASILRFSMDKYITIDGTITLRNGEKIQFAVTSDSDYGFTQWGNSKENLGKTVDLLEQIDKVLKSI